MTAAPLPPVIEDALDMLSRAVTRLASVADRLEAQQDDDETPAV